MRKLMTLSMGALLLLSSCGSYTATGAYVGGTFGNVLGSAIGGISGGYHGHHVGSLIGTLGGVVAGAAVGAAVDNARQRRTEGVDSRARQHAQGADERPVRDNSGFDPSMRGDDRVDFFDAPSVVPIEIRNPSVVDGSRDGVLVRGEECTVAFDIMNTSAQPVYDICPLVSETTGNKHVHVSPNLRIESIMPYQGMRYTATVKADKKLKDGEVVLRISVAVGNEELAGQAREFSVPTKKRL